MKVGFHLPSLADHYRFNMVFASMLKNCPDYFREGVEISSFYGVFPAVSMERRKNSPRQMQ